MILMINKPFLLGGLPPILKECSVTMKGYEVQIQKCSIYSEPVFTELLSALADYSDYAFDPDRLRISVEPKAALKLTYE